MVTMPSGERRTVTTPAAAVSVSRSPGCQPHALGTARSPTRPAEAIRPNPYSTSCGATRITGAVAAGSGRIGPARLAPRAGSRAGEGITGATGRALMAASPQGGTRPRAGSQLELAACAGVQAMSVLGEISPVWVSEGGLE